jgi:penicillin-binding protein 1A
MTFFAQVQHSFSQFWATIRLILSKINHYWQPIKDKFHELMEPVYAIFRPYWEKISPIFDPLRRGWDTYQTAYPRAANYTATAGRWFKNGVKAFVALVFLIWLGIFGRSPSGNDLRHIHTQTATEVYSADSVVVGRYYKFFNRKEISYDEISPNVVNALVAEEDSRFFSHSGIDYRSWARVAVKSVLLRDESQGGGSTITQQLAKNLFPRKHFWFESSIWGLRFITGKISTIINKIQEILIARRIESIHDKREILTLYLNTVPFSRYVYGIDMAAKRFYNTSAKDLSPDKAALLVGMLKGTSDYDPISNPDLAKDRRNAVLRSMVEMDYLKQAECDKFSKLPLSLNYVPESFSEGLATYFRETVRQELVDKLKSIKKEDGTAYDIYADGLKVYTTIDSKMQDYAEQAVQEQMKKVQKNFFSDWRYADNAKKPWNNDTLWRYGEMPKTKRYAALKQQGLSEDQILANFNTKTKMVIFDWESPNHEKEVTMTPADSLKYYLQLINAGFLAMDPKTGAIKAWVGGVDHHFFKIDHIKTKRQVGSTFKPIVYASAIQRGISPCTYFGNYQKVYRFRGEDWEPGNSEDEYGGSYSMLGALRKSLNVISVKLILQKTPDIKPDKIDPESGNLKIEVDKTGIMETIELAKKMGVTSKIKDVPSIALGTVDISLFDMLTVYGTFANRGVRPVPYYINKVVDSNGKVIYDEQELNIRAGKKPERALTEDETDIMTNMLEAVIDDGTGSNIREIFDIRNDIAGKTGTTQDHADAWFMCFTPNIVCGAWSGAEIPKVHFRTLDYGQGAKAALPMCGAFLSKLYTDPKFKKMAQAKFTEPKPEIQELIDCSTYVRDSTFVDSTGTRRAVPGSGVRKKREEEQLQEELDKQEEGKVKDAEKKAKDDKAKEKEIEKQLKEGTDIWQIPSNEYGIATLDRRRFWQFSKS